MSFQLGRILVVLGVFLAAAGLLLMAGARLPFFGLGRLPGDVTVKGRNWTFYLPIGSCLVLSLALTLMFWLISLLTKK